MCSYCDKDYASDSKTNGTSNLWHHLRKQCSKYPYKDEDEKQKILCFQKNSESGVIAVGFSQAACRVGLAKMVIIDELSFMFVEQEGFQQFCKISCSKFDLPSRITLARDVMQLYNDEKVKLKAYFKKDLQRVSLTTDCWFSVQQVNYMVLTAHFIDSDWTLQKRILNFCQIPNHKGETIGKAIEACLQQ